MAEEASAETTPLTWRAYAAVGLLWFLGLQSLSWLGVEASEAYLAVSSLAFLAMGALCWHNGRACGSLHCRISAPGYIAVGLVAALAALGLFSVDRSWLTAAFVAVAVLSYAIEWVLEDQGSAAGA